jgi:hypothetical protein
MLRREPASQLLVARGSAPPQLEEFQHQKGRARGRPKTHRRRYAHGVRRAQLLQSGELGGEHRRAIGFVQLDEIRLRAAADAPRGIDAAAADAILGTDTEGLACGLADRLRDRVRQFLVHEQTRTLRKIGQWYGDGFISIPWQRKMGTDLFFTNFSLRKPGVSKK